MDPSVVEMMVLLAAVVGSGTMTAAGMWFWFRVKKLERENQELKSLGENPGSARIGDQLENVQRQLAELHERMDFTERMLTRGKDDV